MTGRQVFKSHAGGNPESFFDHSGTPEAARNLVLDIYSQATVVYVWRSAPSVFESLYLYWIRTGALDRRTTFSSFLRSPSPGFTGDSARARQMSVVEYWAAHVEEGRRRADVLVDFELLTRDPANALARIVDRTGAATRRDFLDPRAGSSSTTRENRWSRPMRKPQQTGVLIGLGATGRPATSDLDRHYIESFVAEDRWPGLFNWQTSAQQSAPTDGE